MSELVISLDPDMRQSLLDLADAQDRAPEEVVREAVRRHLHQERTVVRVVAERLARHHADLLRRLGE
ncbi:hypothetical protein [Streptomyces griseoflavus]|uniref:hypothetical protein n=1 Tax=Streptomyces griseoflavus TaxID=35619 RepID=UPI0001B4DC03|nr:hypothetical protein [Streptomyces griseoflavus]